MNIKGKTYEDFIEEKIRKIEEDLAKYISKLSF